MERFPRVVVIAPTRSTCLNISVVLDNGAIPSTLLVQEKGTEIFEAVDRLHEGGFGVVAGTGTGKTVAIRDIARRVLGEDVRVDVVTRENEATAYTWTCNVLVVTPGVALHWLKSRTITGEDLVVLDEIHQTSEHLEISMALAKRNKNTFVWMSATIDPAVYSSYLEARTVIHCTAYDPARRAEVVVKNSEVQYVLEDEVDNFISEKRAVAVFVSTRAQAENLAKKFGEHEGLTSDFYHGGEKAEKLRQFLKGEVPKPFMIFMTIAGASSLNVLGLDTVVIVDEMYTEVVHSGVKVLEKVALGNNELLQMGGRVNGRAINGKIIILSRRSIDFHALKPVAPVFALSGGDSSGDLARGRNNALQQVALVCARVGVDLSDLDVIARIDRKQYEAEVKRFKERGIIDTEGNLTAYGREVERLPVTPAWAEVLVQVRESGDEELLKIAIVAASIESLYSLVRKNVVLRDVAVGGSDHLTGYNIVAAALQQFGYIRSEDDGVGYAFQGDYVKKRGNDVEKGIFIAWCDQNGFSNKAIKEVTIAMKSVFRQMNAYLLSPDMFKPVLKGSEAAEKFVDLLARVQSLDFVHDEHNSQAGTVWAAQHSVASAYQTLGRIRFWTDKRGYTRASMEGTQVSEELVQQYARVIPDEILGMSVDGERIRVRYTAMFAEEQIAPVDREHEPDEVPDRFASELPTMFARWLAGQMG
ncbi:MAG: hypothetical protein Q8R30_00635 [bacterium]|nr:hypothetical protein [bacterium]